MHGDPGLARDLDNGIHRLDHACLVIRHHHRDKRPWAACLINLGQHPAKRVRIDTSLMINRDSARIRCRMHDRIMFDRAGDHRIEGRQREIVGLGAAAGKDKVSPAASRQQSDFRSSLFDDHPRGTAIAMHG